MRWISSIVNLDRNRAPNDIIGDGPERRVECPQNRGVGPSGSAHDGGNFAFAAGVCCTNVGDILIGNTAPWTPRALLRYRRPHGRPTLFAVPLAAKGRGLIGNMFWRVFAPTMRRADLGSGFRGQDKAGRSVSAISEVREAHADASHCSDYFPLALKANRWIAGSRVNDPYTRLGRAGAPPAIEMRGSVSCRVPVLRHSPTQVIGRKSNVPNRARIGLAKRVNDPSHELNSNVRIGRHGGWKS